jgi:hypothetical protein
MEISPVDLVLRVASATLGASEVPPNTNTGPYVERVLAGTHTPKGNPWCAAWVTDVGTHALGERWPVLRTASVQQMAEWAESKGIRYTAKPQIGDLFCLWFPKLNRFAHVGIVAAVQTDGQIVTVEGNTSGAGEREGWMVASKLRKLGRQDRLIRWAALL